MRYIHRTETLSCLKNAKKKYHTWTNFKKLNPKGYNLIVDELTKIQDGLCVYCEEKLKKGYHVEHFKCRNQFSQNDLDWDNLFLSCQNTQHCGIYKDSSNNKNYDIKHILKPDLKEDNPSKYFTYLISGDIKCNSNLKGFEKFRAEQTIEILNLNNAELVNNRKNFFLKVQMYFEPKNFEEIGFEKITKVFEELKTKDGLHSFIDSLLKLLK